MNHLSLLYKPFIPIHYFIGNIDWRPLHNGPGATFSRFWGIALLNVLVG